MLKRLFLCFLLLSALSIFGVQEAAAQGCTVSSTTTTAGTSSTACFVKTGGKVNFSLTGTWVGTMTLQRSDDAGASYRTLQSYTSNVASVTDAISQDTRFKWYVSAYTSGTIGYTIADVTTRLGRIAYPTVPIGDTAYASVGISIIGSTTSAGMADLFVEDTMASTGAGVLVGATGGTDKFIFGLYDSTGRLVANTATAGTTVGTASTAQQIAWTLPTTLARGRYVLVVWIDGTTATFRRPVSTQIGLATGSLTSQTFGTVPSTITVPTAIETSVAVGGTNAVGPIGWVY